MSKIIGIDLGISNSRVAVVEGGKPEIIADAQGNRAIPSVVAFVGKEGYLVGQPAKDQAIKNISNTIFSIKRELGTGYKARAGHQEYMAQEITALILMKLKANAEAYLGEKVTGAVITVPASFTNAQRIATRDAGRIAGFKDLRLINEPSAAAIAYDFGKKDTRKVLLCNLGAGSFEFSLMEIGDNVFEVLATASDDRLGGQDFDQRIVDSIANEFLKKHLIDLRRDAMALQRLKDAAEKAKIELSSQMSASINLPFIAVDANGPLHLDMTISRAKFKEITVDLTGRIILLVNQVMRDAGISAGEIAEVFLAGGSSRIPAVQSAIQRSTGKESLNSANPDECAAVGAAIYGGMLNGGFKDLVLLDAMPASLGIETAGGAFTKLIERNATIPIRRDQVFSTASDGQTSIELHVLQGENERAAENKSLGRFQLTGIAPAPKGVPKIQVAFEIDPDGIVHVSAKDQATGKEQAITRSASAKAEKEIPKQTSHQRTSAVEKKAEAAVREIELTGDVGKIIEVVLPVIDNLERALSAARPGDPLATGVEMTLKMLLDGLRKQGLEEIPALGMDFDPHKHNAVASERRGQPGKVLEVFQKGYRMKDKVIRYAMVKVSV